MRRTCGLGSAVAVLALALGCGKNTSATTHAGIEGGWTLVAIEASGHKATGEEFAKVPEAEKKVRATADTLLTTKGGREAPLKYKLDPSKSPHEVDLTSAKSDGTTETLFGIYKLEGDTLTICAVESDTAADRPKEFKSTPDNKAIIMTLKKD